MRLNPINGAILLTTLSIAALAGGCSNNASYSETAKAAEHIETNETDAEAAGALKLIEKMPDSPWGYTQLAVLNIRRARQTGDFSLNVKAEEAIDSALAIAPQDPPARKLKLALHATFHRFEEARLMGQALLEEFPNDAFIYGILTDANIELGNYDAAVAAAQKMMDLKPNSSSYARAGHIRSLYGDHKGAVEMMTLAAKTADPMDKEAQSWSLTMLAKEYLKNGNIAKARNVLNESLTILPGYSLAQVEKARILAHDGDLEAATGLLADNGSVPLSPNALVLRGDIATKQGDTKKAAAEYERAEAAIHVDGDMHRLSLLWADREIRLDEALEIAEADFATNKDIYAADIYAWCLYKKERFQEAKEVIGLALRLDTMDARIIYHAGMIENAVGNKNEAKRLLALALKTNPAFDLLQSVTAKTALQTLK
jgi:tetratricopeptide (TPR) repeat protein